MSGRLLNLDNILLSDDIIIFGGKEYKVKPATFGEILLWEQIVRTANSTNVDEVSKSTRAMKELVERRIPGFDFDNLPQAKLQALATFLQTIGDTPITEAEKKRTPKR